MPDAISLGPKSTESPAHRPQEKSTPGQISQGVCVWGGKGSTEHWSLLFQVCGQDTSFSKLILGLLGKKDPMSCYNF